VLNSPSRTNYCVLMGAEHVVAKAADAGKVVTKEGGKTGIGGGKNAEVRGEG